jgi:hypothetical protein
MVLLDINRTLYHEMVGLSVHLTNTCPNIAFAIGMVNWFMSQPQETHLEAMKHIFEYIKSIEDHGFIFEQGVISVLNGHMNEIRLVTRGQGTQHVLRIGENMVAWCSKKQPTMRLSSIKVEYCAL